MEKENKLLVSLDLITLAIVFLVTLAVLFPIYSVTNFYPFYSLNILFIAVLLIGIRFLFGIKYSFLAKRQTAKIVIMLLMVPVVFLLISQLNAFMAYVEDSQYWPMTGHLPDADRIATERYIWREMIFFGLGSIIVCILLPVTLFKSVWRTRNPN
jgi:DMSO reductase anchor subunit